MKANIRGSLSLLATGALLLASCRGPAPSPSSPPSSLPVASSSWRHMPLSWGKLDAIEAWLDGPEARSNPGLRLEAELELAEGLVHFAGTERAAERSSLHRARLAKARRSFQSIADDPFATALQKRRATRGLESLDGLAKAPAVATSGSVTQSVLPRTAWGASPPVPGRLTRNRAPWSRITVHHSGPPDGNLGTSAAVARDTLQRIQKHHISNQGWGDIGYHFLIDPAGRLYEGRSLQWQGAHAGYDANNRNNNTGNIGICLLGDFVGGTQAPSQSALTTLRSLVDDLCRVYGIPPGRLYGHKSLKVTDCPGPALEAWVASYRRGQTPVEAAARTLAPVRRLPGASSGVR